MSESVACNVSSAQELQRQLAIFLKNDSVLLAHCSVSDDPGTNATDAIQAPRTVFLPRFELPCTIFIVSDPGFSVGYDAFFARVVLHHISAAWKVLLDMVNLTILVPENKHARGASWFLDGRLITCIILWGGPARLVLGFFPVFDRLVQF